MNGDYSGQWVHFAKHYVLATFSPHSLNMTNAWFNIAKSSTNENPSLL